MLGPTLLGEKITLEPARPEDIDLRLRWFADLELSRYWTGPEVPSRAQEEDAFRRASEDGTVVLWRIALNGATIGSAWLSDIEWRNRQAKQGMVIGDREHWGKGYGSEVVRLRTAYAFDNLGLERLETSSVDFNIAMHRALLRSGFRTIGTRQHRFFLDGKWHDELIFELLQEEWRRDQPS